MDNPETLEAQDTRMETNETNQKQHRNVNRTTPKVLGISNFCLL